MCEIYKRLYYSQTSPMLIMNELMALKRGYNECIDDFRFRIQKIANGLHCSEAEKQNYCKTVFTQNLSNEIQFELLKSDEDFSFIGLTNFASKLEKIKNELENKNIVGNFPENKIEARIDQIEDRLRKQTKNHKSPRKPCSCKCKKGHRFTKFVPDSSKFSKKSHHSKPKHNNINSVSYNKVSKILTEGICHNRIACMFIDSGSTVSIISPKFIEECDLTEKIEPCKIKLKSFTSDSIHVIE